MVFSLPALLTSSAVGRQASLINPYQQQCALLVGGTQAARHGARILIDIVQHRVCTAVRAQGGTDHKSVGVGGGPMDQLAHNLTQDPSPARPRLPSRLTQSGERR